MHPLDRAAAGRWSPAQHHESSSHAPQCPVQDTTQHGTAWHNMTRHSAGSHQGDTFERVMQGLRVRGMHTAACMAAAGVRVAGWVAQQQQRAAAAEARRIGRDMQRRQCACYDLVRHESACAAAQHGTHTSPLTHPPPGYRALHTRPASSCLRSGRNLQTGGAGDADDAGDAGGALSDLSQRKNVPGGKNVPRDAIRQKAPRVRFRNPTFTVMHTCNAGVCVVECDVQGMVLQEPGKSSEVRKIGRGGCGLQERVQRCCWATETPSKSTVSK